MKEDGIQGMCEMVPYGVKVWKEIRKGCYELKNRSHFDVKNGKKVRFWKDNWYWYTSLKETFRLIVENSRNVRFWKNN